MTARAIDTNGWIEIKGNPITRVGVFQYLGSDLDLGLDPNQFYNVYRSAEELQDQETINSFRLLPWTNDHPDRLLGDNAGRIPAEDKGIEGVIGEDIYFDGDFLRANLKVFSNDLAQAIESGKKELSAGYSSQYELQSGIWNGQRYDVIQRNIRGNHVALVDEGRSGPEVSVLDQKYNKDEATMKENMIETKAVDEGEGAAGLAGLSAKLDVVISKLEMLMPSAKAEVTDESPDDKKSDDKTTKDADEEKKDDKKDDKKDAMDAAAIRKSLFVEISHRDQLAKKLSPHIGVFDHAEMSLAEVAKYGVKKLGLNCKSGHEISILDGYLMAAKSNATQSVATLDHRQSVNDDQVTSYLNEIRIGGK